MGILLRVLLAISAVFAVNAEPDFDRYLLKLDEGTSQFSSGYLYNLDVYYPDPHPIYTDRAYDFLNKRFSATFNNVTTDRNSYQKHITSANGTKAVRYDLCTDTPSYTFDLVVGAFAYPYLRYLGTTSLGGQVYKMFAGVSDDLISERSRLPNVMFVHDTNNAIVFHARMQNAGFDYFVLPHLTLGSPSYDKFAIPAYCGTSNTTLCNPPCGYNAQCDSNKVCTCLKNYTGNPLVECTSPTTEFDAGITTFEYDKFTLANGSDAKSQTSIGVYVDPIKKFRQYSAWVQDVSGERIRFDIGTPGQAGSVSYLLTSEGSYTATYSSHGQVNCSNLNTSFPSYFFYRLFYPTLRYLGNVTYNNVPCHMYAGNGHLPNSDNKQGIIKYVAADGLQFKFMAVLNEQGYTYYDFTDTTMGKPDESWFDKEQICNPKSDASGQRLNGAFIFIALAGVLAKYYA